MSAIGSLFGGSGDKGPPVNQLPINNIPQTETATTGGIQGLQGLQGDILSGYMPNLNTELTANTTGGQFGQTAAFSTIPGATNVGMGSIGGAQNLQGAAGAVLGTAFDPQQDLYKKLFQQNQDQTNVTNAMYGVQNTPYGAGVANDSNINFNLGWQDRQLGRQIAGGNAADSWYQGAQPLANMGQAGVVNSAILPYATVAGAAQQNQGAQGQAIGDVTGSQQPAIQDLLAYLGWGSGTNASNNAALTNAFNAGTARQKLGFQELGDVAEAGAGIAGMVPWGGINFAGA